MRITKKTAQEKAELLCQLLQKTAGGTWVPHVWENLGWHYRAELKGGSISIREYEFQNGDGTTYKKYGNTMSDTIGEYSATPTMWSDKQNHDTPAEAVIGQLQKALNLQNKIYKIINANLDQL